MNCHRVKLLPGDFVKLRNYDGQITDLRATKSSLTNMAKITGETAPKSTSSSTAKASQTAKTGKLKSVPGGASSLGHLKQQLRKLLLQRHQRPVLHQAASLQETILLLTENPVQQVLPVQKLLLLLFQTVLKLQRLTEK